MDTSVFYDMIYGMFFIGTKDGERKVGCVVNTVCQMTSSPIQVTVAINKKNYTTACIEKSGYFTVSILSEQTRPELIGVFGFKSSKDYDKFENVRHETLGQGMPIVTENTTGCFLCKITGRHDQGTHILFTAQVTDSRRIGGGPPMSYGYYYNVIKGKASKNAPTYIDQKKEPTAEAKGPEDVCPICGYVYDGSEGDFDALPDTWPCPICGTEKKDFERKESA